MKKYCVLVMMFILSACHYNKEFKNPIFNQPLRPLSRGGGYAYLTPTSIDFRTPLDKNKIAAQAKCDLIENQEDRITLKCMVDSWSDKITKWYFTYTIGELLLDNCLVIWEYSYDSPDSPYKNQSTYCVTPQANRY